MNLQNLLNQFSGSNTNNQDNAGGLSGGLDQLKSKIPGGLAGGAAAGGIMALLMTNKKARKFAGKAATVGGTALLGGLAFSAFKNWQSNNQQAAASAAPAAFDAVDQMELDNDVKGVVFDLLRQPISVAELAQGVDTLEQKTEVYLASFLAINPDHPSEKAHLDQLAKALALPAGLPEHLQAQAQQAFE